MENAESKQHNLRTAVTSSITSKLMHFQLVPVFFSCLHSPVNTHQLFGVRCRRKNLVWLKIQRPMSLKIAKVAENYSMQKTANVTESSASLNIRKL